jgi:DNA-binding NtrC family response regulator
MMVMGPVIDLQDLPPYLHRKAPAPHAGEPAEGHPPPASPLEEQERALIIRALKAAGGNQSQAARELRIGRDALRYKIKKHGLDSQLTQ